eukprot:EG_transcript_216
MAAARPGSPAAVSLLRGDPNAGGDPNTATWSSPPRRPLSSSWEQAADDGGSTTSDTVKPVSAVLQLVDVEREETRVVVGEEPLGTEATRRLADAMGAASLYDAYHEAYGEGSAPVGKLPQVFEAAGLQVTRQQLEAAVNTFYPEVTASGSIGYQQCQELYLHLQQQRQRAETQEEELGKAGHFARWMARASDSDSTNLLLCLVVTLCCMSAFLAGGLAILLLALDDADNARTRLQENLAIVQDSLEVYASQLGVQESNERQAMFTATLASVLQYIGFSATVDANRNQLLRVVTSVANTLGAWWVSQPEQAFVHHASLSALLANASTVKYGCTGTAAIFDEMNANGMPPNYEVLLGRWRANATAAVEYLTDFRYRDQCPNGVCIVDNTTTAPMVAALSGKTSAGMAVDYRGSAVYAGYTALNNVGVQVNYDYWALLLQRFYSLVPILNSWTEDSTTWEYMLGYMPAPGVRQLLSALPGCDAACQEGLLVPGMPLYRALAGETGAMTYTNFRGVKSVVAFAPLPNTQCGLAVHMDFTDIVTRGLQVATALVDNLNQNYPWNSEEFELVAFSRLGNATNFTHLSAYKYKSQCPLGQCVLATTYVTEAARNCSTGVMRTSDYRGTPVLVGYTCLAELGVVLAAKLDVADVDADVLGTVVEAINSRSAKDNHSSAQYLVAAPKAGLTVEQVKGYGDFDLLTKLKYPNACAAPNCSWHRESALRALQGATAAFDTRDYRDVAVLAAPALSREIGNGIGVAVELDHTEAMQPTVDTMIRVGAFTAGLTVGCTALLVLVMKWTLRSMIAAKEEGNRVVETERERFSRLVASMYPPFVVPRLLQGEKQMVCEVPGAAVFFSDIHEFTSASNTLGSKDLLQLLAYVYGVMDSIADRFHVYKVKTIGDAYLAVRGLPGADTENPSLDLLRFASCVCQVFGDRFVHPTEGQVLAAMNRAMAWNGQAGRKARLASKGKARGSEADAASQSQGRSSSRKGPPPAGSRTSLASSPRAEDKVQCIMSYGLAVGKLVAGVLAGRCPMFDIWGGTVNLASRMQSTGEPGRIQVSEQLYKKVIAVPGQPFAFEAPRSTFCKGFGHVNAYMVRTTAEGLPKDLQEQLQLEPRYGAFQFDNILSAASGRPDAKPSTE